MKTYTKSFLVFTSLVCGPVHAGCCYCFNSLILFYISINSAVTFFIYYFSQGCDKNYVVYISYATQ